MTSPHAVHSSATAMQAKIRQNALDVQDCLSSFRKWEKEAKAKDVILKKERHETTHIAAPGPRGSGTAVSELSCGSSKVETRTTGEGEKRSLSFPHPASHTYDRGYDKWRKFDADQALEDADDPSEGQPNALRDHAGDLALSKSEQASMEEHKPSGECMDEVERLRGNDFFKNKEYTSAIRCYTRSLGLNPQNATTFSNRALAYLKVRDFMKAEMDATSAIELSPTQVKALYRRAVARNGLGKHRLALLDLENALNLDRENAQLLSELQRTRQLSRAAIKRVPLHDISITLASETSTARLKPGDKTVKSNFDLEGHRVGSSNVPLLEQYSEQPQHADFVRDSLLQTGGDNAPSSVRKALSVDDNQNLETQSTGSNNVESANGHGNGSEIQERTEDGQLDLRSHTGLPLREPSTFYDFSRVWRSLAGQDSSKLRFQYLQLISAKKFQKVFKDSLDADLLLEVVRTICANMSRALLPSVLGILRGFSAVRRFEIVRMLLGKEENAEISAMFNELLALTDDEGVDSETERTEIQSMAKLYL